MGFSIHTSSFMKNKNGKISQMNLFIILTYLTMYTRMSQHNDIEIGLPKKKCKWKNLATSNFNSIIEI
jgi:hypothetical protein